MTDFEHVFMTIDEALIAARLHAVSLGRGIGGRELSLVITKLQESRMWAEQAERELAHHAEEEK